MPTNIKFLTDNRATHLHNLTCVYCGKKESAELPFEKEHVVGRKFAPKGSFGIGKGWVFTVRACCVCNDEKADLEDDISATTLHPWYSDEQRDPVAEAHVQRKAHGSISRITKKPIGESFHEHALEGPFMGAGTIRFNLIAPSQLVTERVFKLARMHLQAFFYLITYDYSTGTGKFMPGDVGFVAEASRSDWGNPQMQAFAELTRTWDTFVCGGGANGHFQIAIRRAPVKAEVLSFALEWNASMRVVGFFGDLTAAQTYVDSLPTPEWKRFDANNRYRELVPLAGADDPLFAPGP